MVQHFLIQLFANGGMWSKHLHSANKVVNLAQGSQTRGPRGHFVLPAMLSGNVQIFNVCVAKHLEKRCREIN